MKRTLKSPDRLKLGENQNVTRKHFQALADMVNEARQPFRKLDQETVRAMAEGIANVCKRDNPGFKRERFLRACGYDA